MVRGVPERGDEVDQASAGCKARCTSLCHGTRVLSFGDDESPCSGQTLWGDSSPRQSAGVAWDWVEVQSGVVAMSDPLGLVTNLKLLDDHGEALTHIEVAVQLHQLVHALPWQSEVRRALHPAGG